MTRYSKRQQHLLSLEKRKYNIPEALDFFLSSPTAKFRESIDVSINLGIDPEKSDQNVRGATSLPSGSGKSCKVAVFVEDNLVQEVKEAGADATGMEDLANRLKKEEDFDVIIATPDTMKIVSPLGKILGPKGIMPNPKTGTVTKDVINAVKNAKAGQIRYRADKAGIVHGRIGDLSFSAEKIQKNVEALLEDLNRNKPSSSKGIFIKKISLSSTMGAGIEIDLSSLSF
ncbi:MAG: 50S ribosomal protein L1 [Gammaproteobacteria bacterium]|nr:50S ribosomal protein L1 [Gammaproteobacteria bacterium]|tara:strand:- start:2954 stop:3640 length:687 start_codon:yes stop_codon:yes gene_type:complete